MIKNQRQELYRFCLFLGVSVIAWQSLPDRYWGPFNALNPHAITEFVVTILCISAVGKLSMQFLGERYGLILTGLIGGFASSTATIYAMGTTASKDASQHRNAVIGAILSSASTLVQIVFLADLLAPPLIIFVLQPIGGGLVAMLAASLLYFNHFMNERQFQETSLKDTELVSWRSLVSLVFLVTSISFLSGVLFSEFGTSALTLIAAISGLVDAHAVIPSLAAFVNQGTLTPQAALIPIMIAFSVNTFTKCLIAFQSGGAKFGFQVSVALGITAAGAWMALVIGF